MNEFYLVIVVVLMALAVSDLIVGVSNDAVNFLNSAIGSKAAPFKVIMLIASIGIILGAMFSNGMMEVARKGVFHPESFAFSEIMILFFAVMITDILLLDFFNTIGLPTSTTVSIVFELLGAAVAVALVKISATGGDYSTLGTYINSGNALLIISGILISIVVAFTVGTIVQYLSRLLFTFNYTKKLRYFGSLWGGLAISLMLYFIIVKGAKGSTIISGDTIKYIEQNSLMLVLASFASLTIVFQAFTMLFKFNILKLVVLVGTFGLAMAFAGNDLVNFIGVPLAGLSSYKAFIASGLSDPTMMTMEFLKGEVKSDTYLLLIASLVMVATLWFSRKARTVTETEISLGRQDSGFEKFGSSLSARSIVRQALNLNTFYKSVLPDRFINWSNSRFAPARIYGYSNRKDVPAFDLIRATVNLTVASVLIAFATSLKLPLSTTYVTFMVAMGTSLSDKAWGRESAVYRVTGVMTVIGGWFFTAFIAFSISMLVAAIVSYGGMYAISGFILLTLFFITRTHIIHRKKVLADSEALNVATYTEQSTGEEIIKKCNSYSTEILNLSGEILLSTIEGLASEDRKLLRQTRQNVRTLVEKAKLVKAGLPSTIRALEMNNVDTSHKYIQVVDYLREITRSVRTITEHATEHVENNHEPLSEIQTAEIHKVIIEMKAILDAIVRIKLSTDYSAVSELKTKQAALDELINASSQDQVSRMANERMSSKSAMLYINLMFEIGNLVNDSIHLIKAQRVFSSRLTK